MEHTFNSGDRVVWAGLPGLALTVVDTDQNVEGYVPVQSIFEKDSYMDLRSDEVSPWIPAYEEFCPVGRMAKVEGEPTLFWVKSHDSTTGMLELVGCMNGERRLSHEDYVRY